MKLNNEQYNELVEKLADEIIEDHIEKEAKLNFKSGGAKKTFNNVKNTFSGRNVKEAVKDYNAFSEAAKAPKNKITQETLDGLKKDIGKAKVQRGAAIGGAATAGVGATGAAGYGVKKVLDKKNSKKESEQIEQQACELYEYALRKVAACEEMYNDAIEDQESCIEVLAEVGLYDEYGFNKEASESNEEIYEFTEGVSSVYDESLQKIAAAEECYEEAIEDLGTAIEVLAHFGYEFE